jgi:hypothetical protein
MRSLFIIILLFICHLEAFGQEGKFIPFKLLILKPDTAIIEKSLYNDIDSVYSEYLKRYYYSIKRMEEFVNYSSDDSTLKATQQKMKENLLMAKTLEPEVKKFKYFHLISSYSTEIYNFYFNAYPPHSTVIELPSQQTDIVLLKKLADANKADYIVFFNNIYTKNKEGVPILKLTTSLYSAEKNKLILTKETEGDTFSRGSMWTCSGSVLSCLLINGVRTSTEEVTKILYKAQLKK